MIYIYSCVDHSDNYIFTTNDSLFPDRGNIDITTLHKSCNRISDIPVMPLLLKIRIVEDRSLILEHNDRHIFHKLDTFYIAKVVTSLCKRCGFIELHIIPKVKTFLTHTLFISSSVGKCTPCCRTCYQLSALSGFQSLSQSLSNHDHSLAGHIVVHHSLIGGNLTGGDRILLT